MAIITRTAEEIYTGPTIVTPSLEQQVLQTTDYLLKENITVNSIPSQYMDTNDATLIDSTQLFNGITAYARGIKYTGSLDYATGEQF